jgi:hypothetical protein
MTADTSDSTGNGILLPGFRRYSMAPADHRSDSSDASSSKFLEQSIPVYRLFLPM